MNRENALDNSNLGADWRAIIRWEDNNGKLKSLYLREDDTAQLGREASSNDVVLDNQLVSRRHAVVTWQEGAYGISDLGSINGTSVNGERIHRPRNLEDGDVIRLDNVKLTFHLLVQTETVPEFDDKTTFVVPPSTPQPRLIISAGAQEGREIPLYAGKIIIGRATAKNAWGIALQDQAISRPHAELERKEEGYILNDLDSPNGTLVNGEMIEDPTLLRDGDVILLGETTLLFRAI